MLVELDGCRWSAVVDLVVVGVANVGDIIKIVCKKNLELRIPVVCTLNFAIPV
jgi:hypothetical protein